VRRGGDAATGDRNAPDREAGDGFPALAPALRAAARRHGTPLYVTDGAALEAAADAVCAAFPDPWLRSYSLKANDLPALVARLAARGFGANVVSRGEWELARRAGIPNAAITLEGIGKTDADLRAAVRAAAAGEPLRWVAVESADEAAALAGAIEAARRRGRGSARQRQRQRRRGPVDGPQGRGSAHLPPLRVDALVRLNPSVDPETHAGLATGARGSKFGVHPDEVGAVIEAGGGADGPVHWRGIHLHVGSQLGAIDAWRDAVRRGLALLARLQGGMPDFDTLDVGGGMPVAPWRAGAGGLVDPVSGVGGTDGNGAAGGATAAAPSPERFAAEIPLLLAAIPADRRPRRLAVEPGRAMIASAGWLVARVLHVRERTLPPDPITSERSGAHALAVLPPGSTTDDRTRRLVVVDAGMTELIRPALYGAEHAVVALTSLGRVPRPDVAARPTRVDGPICESTDTLGEHLLPPLRRGDLVAIADAGAYAASMRSTYNGRPRPAEVIVEADGALTLARRRGTLGSLA
jgi:diaminopimelate decarboxylase